MDPFYRRQISVELSKCKASCGLLTRHMVRTLMRRLQKSLRRDILSEVASIYPVSL